MYICYIDESGIVESVPENSHFVLAGFAVRADFWRQQDQEVTALKQSFGLVRAEIHTAWMLRRYLEQESIPGFEGMDHAERRRRVQAARRSLLNRIELVGNRKKLKKYSLFFRKTDDFIHLTLAERRTCLRGLADLIGSWGHARIFAEAIDKNSFGGRAPRDPLHEQAFDQVVSRFHSFLNRIGNPLGIGLLAHDNNETVAKRLTELMRNFHDRGTLWTDIDRIIETPFFVDSQLISGIQLADICAYAIRRFFEKNEMDLFDRIFDRFDRFNGRLVGIRHFTLGVECDCRVCLAHA